MNALKQMMTAGGASRIRVVAAGGLQVMAVAAVAAYRHFGSRVSTDDAQVDAHIAPIGAKVAAISRRFWWTTTRSSRPGRCCCGSTRATTRRVSTRRCAALAAAESQGAARMPACRSTNATTASVTAAAAARSWPRRTPITRGRQTDFDRASSSELASAKADVEAKRATADRARADLARMAPLAAKDEISRQQFDAYVAAAARSRSAS